MQVEVWADVICPWCGLGAHRLDAALERFPHRDEVQVTRGPAGRNPAGGPAAALQRAWGERLVPDRP